MTRALGPVVVALAALCVLLPGAPATAQAQADHFVTGTEKFERGEYNEAVNDLLQAVQEHPDWESAWYYLGAAQFEVAFQNLGTFGEPGARDYSAAKQSLLKALELAPSRPGTRMYLGRIEEDTGAYAEALRLYREELSLKRLVDRKPTNVALARASYKLGRYDDAMTLLNSVLSTEPKYIEARYYLGLCQVAKQRPQDALETYKSATKTLNEWLEGVYHLLRVQFAETDPTDYSTRVTRVVEDWDQLRKELWALRTAKARPTTKTLEQHTQTYARAQEFALDLHLWPELNKATGDAYMLTKDWAAARNAYRHAMKSREGEGSEDDPDAWARIGRAYHKQAMQTFADTGQLLRTAAELKASEGDTDTDPLKWDGYGRALYAAGINHKARLSDMEAPREPAPEIAKIFSGLGEVYLFEANTYVTDPTRDIKSHTYEEAIEAFDKALLYDASCVPAMLHKGEAMIDRAEREKLPSDKIDGFMNARDLLEGQALKLNAKDPMVWAALARAYLGLDELNKAEQAANSALTLDRKNLVALNMAGLVKYYRNDCIGAVDDFTTAIETAPKDFQSYLNLGNALYGLRSWGRAQREYNRALELVPQSSVSNTGSQRPYVKYLIARTQHELGDYQLAVNTLSEALSLRTDFYDAQRLLAASYSGLRQWRAAEESLKGAIKSAASDDVEKQASSHTHLGELYEVGGRYHEAMAEYRTALSYSPDYLRAQEGVRRLTWQEKKRPATSGSSQ